MMRLEIAILTNASIIKKCLKSNFAVDALAIQQLLFLTFPCIS